jgi:NADH-quinone oxidoreductase subunit N
LLFRLEKGLWVKAYSNTTEMHSIDFLLIIPECFQIALINFFLLFAICFSYYRKNPKLEKPNIRLEEKSSLFYSDRSALAQGNKMLLSVIGQTNFRLEQQGSIDPKQSKRLSQYFGVVKLIGALIPTPITKIEPIIQLIILALVCSSILYINCPVIYGVGLTDSIIWDSLSRLMSVLVCASASASLILSITAISRFGRYEFLFIIWLSIIGMLCLIKSYNFLTIYLSVELQSLSFYMLAAMRSKTEASAEAGLKYFILSAFSSAILLLGITLIYAVTGSQNFADLNIIINYFNSQVNIPISLNIGLGCVCISLLFKLAAAPFHAWIADVYEGSPTPITAFFAITAKIGACAAFIRVMELHVTTFELLPFIAVLSLIIGSLSAMRQVKLKRLLAFSGVTNVGWFILALITGQWHLLVIHLIIYILLSTCLFSIFILPLFRTHPNLEYRQRTAVQGQHIVDHGTDSLAIKYISDLNQLHKTNPSLAFAMVIAFFSLAGIPPLAGFYSKYLIINALTQTEQYLTLLIALVSAVLSAFYYIRVIKTIYFPPLELRFTRQNPKVKSLAKDRFKMFTIMAVSSNAYICAFSAILTIFFFIKPDYFCIWIIFSQLG